jgi:hypothetical protein
VIGVVEERSLHFHLRHLLVLVWSLALNEVQGLHERFGLKKPCELLGLVLIAPLKVRNGELAHPRRLDLLPDPVALVVNCPQILSARFLGQKWQEPQVIDLRLFAFQRGRRDSNPHPLAGTGF